MQTESPYLAIGGGYSYCPLRVGLVLRDPAGAEVYFQPGDQESAIRETFDALGEIDEGLIDRLADIALSDYFA